MSKGTLVLTMVVDQTRAGLHVMTRALQGTSCKARGMLAHARRWGDSGDANFGDVHFYDYASDCLDPAAYPRAKFVSEFGYQSWPSWPVYRRVTRAEDWSRTSAMSQYRWVCMCSLCLAQVVSTTHSGSTCSCCCRLRVMIRHKSLLQRLLEAFIVVGMSLS